MATTEKNLTSMCCVEVCDRPLDKDYWDSQYKNETIGWDIGYISPPLKEIIDQIIDKNAKILIPGAGNAYEATYLLEQGFTNVHVIDIAPEVIHRLANTFGDNKNIRLFSGNFFDHEGEYDYILEQTFFCALPPQMRPKYLWKMFHLLAPQGILTGVLFNRLFESGPPFGGSTEEYQSLFTGAFEIEQMSLCSNSIAPRARQEVLLRLKKNNEKQVHLYSFQGITCTGCKKAVTEKFLSFPGVDNVAMSSDFASVTIVSENEINLALLKNAISYDSKYTIEKAS
jgi:hypothetical protein